MGDYLLLALWWLVGFAVSAVAFGQIRVVVAWRVVAALAMVALFVLSFVGYMMDLWWAAVAVKGWPGNKVFVIGVAIGAFESLKLAIGKWWRYRREVNKAS